MHANIPGCSREIKVFPQINADEKPADLRRWFFISEICGKYKIDLKALLL
jgi:hypothetical protein